MSFPKKVVADRLTLDSARIQGPELDIPVAVCGAYDNESLVFLSKQLNGSSQIALQVIPLLRQTNLHSRPPLRHAHFFTLRKC